MRHKIFAILIFFAVIWTAVFWMPVSGHAEQTERLCGGITIFKTDVFGNALPGAGFQITREATHQELTDSSITKRLLRADGALLTVVYDSFWTTREMSGKKQTEVVTGESGIAEVYGLPYGTYYLVESRAPEGYNPMPEPLRITINKYSHLTAADDVRDDEGTVIDNTVHIITIRYSASDSWNRSPMHLIAAAAMLCFVFSVFILFRLRRGQRR